MAHRFCTRCGALIDQTFCVRCGTRVDAPPSEAPLVWDQQTIAPQSPVRPVPMLGRGRPKLLIALATVLVLALLGGAGYVGLRALDGDEPAPKASLDDQPPASADAASEDSTAKVSECDSDPDGVPVESSSVDDGVVIAIQLSAACPGGQWLSSDDFRILVTGPGGAKFADGAFDFSGAPMWVPEAGDDGEGARLDAWFGVGSVWALPGEINAGIDQDEVLLDFTDSGTSEATAEDPPTDPDEGDEVSADAAKPAASQAKSRNQSSLAALRRLSAQDKGPVGSELAGTWVPQLSSKKFGTFDPVDSHRFTYNDIYDEHLELRLKYPDARLVWSGDWGSFRLDDYWVTVSGKTFPDGDGANAWCDAEGFAPSQCLAKKITKAGPVEGSTELR